MTPHPSSPSPDAGAAPDWFTPGRFALMLGLLLFATFPGVALGTQSFFYRDYGFLAYPNVFFQRECFWDGELPLWNPYVNCGAPFLAQWNTLALYPGALIYLLLPLPWGLGVFCLAHLFLGGLGMRALAERWTGNRFAAAVAGVAFVFGGTSLTCHIYPNYLVAFGWMPWVVMLVERACLEGGRAIVLAALVGAMQMMSGAPELILMTWILVAALALCEIQSPRLDMQNVARVGGRLLVVVALVAGLCAVVLLPFFDLLSVSQRAKDFGGGELGAGFWSLPAWGWANFFVPLFHCFKTSQGIYVQAGQSFLPSYYAGLGVLALAALAVWRVRERRVRVLAGATVLAVLMAMGTNAFLYGWVAKFVPVEFMRFPVKFILLTAFTLPLLAGLGVAGWNSVKHRTPGMPLSESLGISPSGSLVEPLALVAVGLVLAWAYFSPLPTDDWNQTIRNAALRVVFLGVAFYFLWLHDKGQPVPPKIGLIVQVALLFIIWLDLLTHSPRQNPTIPASAFDPGVVQKYLGLSPEPRLGGTRVMLSPASELAMHVNMVPDFQNDFLGQRAALWGNLNLLDGIPKVNGATTLLTRDQAEVERLLYGTTTNGFSGLLDFLAVSHTTMPGEVMKWIARTNPMPMVSIGQRPVFASRAEILRGLQNTGFDPTATVFLATEFASRTRVTNGAGGRILTSRFRRDRVLIEVEAGERSLVVVAQTHDRNWQAHVDGKPAQWLPVNLAFGAVEVPQGRHTVEIRYLPGCFRAGLILTGMSLLLCAVAWQRTDGHLPQLTHPAR